ncbi:2-amino-4-hydroxy-6-hydroxymethyldihydropteridine diphosphokinase [Gordonia sp. (in: high G+C Gram-positive bacteria)]|uniref:2-amino-4-hydroxy-6- hydroxymethyldihydropteridine diphosphokinase n=1 Tax=Gordonia sp. (in: high G+C Gram-positive bacteria) TaxID=84139 RepID=UPI003C75482E
MTTRVVLSAGSNIGDSRGHLQAVVDAVGADLIAASAVYSTPPWGGVDQDDFANITLIAEGSRTPRQWLEFCWELERVADRVRNERWGPRTLDVDVVAAETDGEPVISDDDELTLPHPRASQRAFVLVPWLEIDPDATLWTASGEQSVVELVAALDADDVAAVRRLEATP